MSAPDPLRYSRCHLAPTLSSLAAHLGYLDEEFARLSPDTPVEHRLGDLDHSADRYWMRHAANAKALYGRSKGAETRVIGLSWYESALPIFVRADSAINGPADLAGQRIAAISTVDGSFDYDRMVYLFPFAAALDSAGLAFADVTEVTTPIRRETVVGGPAKGLAFPQQVARILVGQILSGACDAIALGLTDEAATFLGLRKIVDPWQAGDESLRADPRALVVSTAALRDRRPAVVAAVVALLRAERWARSHAAGVVPGLAADSHIPEPQLAARRVDFPRSAALGVGEDLVGALRRRAALLSRYGVIGAGIDVDGWTDGSVLDEARQILALREAEMAGGAER